MNEMNTDKALRTCWRHGDKTELARRAGITKEYLSKVLAQGGCSVDVAKRLEKAAKSMGIGLDAVDVLMPEDSANPLVCQMFK